MDDVGWAEAAQRVRRKQGFRADYVRNLEANPHVRVRVRQGLRLRWRSGTARIVSDDPRARQRAFSRRKPGRKVTALAVRVMGSELLTVRIDLDPLPAG